MGSDGDDMCNQSKELAVVVTELLNQLKNEQSAARKQSEMTFSVRDLTIPFIFLIPIVISGGMFIWQISNYFARIDQKLELLERSLTSKTADRLTIRNMANICYSWQVDNATLRLNCHRFMTNPSEYITNALPHQKEDK